VRIKRWQTSLGLPAHRLAFQDLYNSVDGFKMSRIARNKKDALDYIYGEIDFLSFIALLSLTKPDHNTVFYDLGSGVGKAVLACAMVFPVRKSVGVELLSELHLCACELKKRLATDFKYEHQAQKIDFILGDFLDIPLEDATLIFINSSTLFGTTWEKLCLVLDNSPQACTIISTSKPLISTVFAAKISTRIQMSWGIVPVYIHQRKTNIH
jgi:SAM-dependent methyltransferase